MKTRLAFLTLMLAALVLSACNLSRARPTPTFAEPTITDLPPLPILPDATPRVTEGENGERCVVPESWIEYTIEQGDTLSLLADQTGSTMEELARVNCITDPDDLVEGAIMYLPRPPVIDG